MAINLGRLQAVLLSSGLQQTNPALYQVITQLINAVIQGLAEAATAGGSGSGGGALSDQHYLTHQNDLANLPQSRQLLAGTGITFDDSVFGERTVNADEQLGREWSVLTNGDATNPELVFAGGDVIMVHTP